MDTNQGGMPETPMSSENQPQSAQKNIVMAALAYLGILIIIPYLTGAKNDPFVKFHMKQGLVLLVCWVAVFVLSLIPVIGLIGWLLDLGLFVLMILGIINVVGGKMQPLAVIGRFANSFNF